MTRANAGEVHWRVMHTMSAARAAANRIRCVLAATCLVIASACATGPAARDAEVSRPMAGFETLEVDTLRPRIYAAGSFAPGTPGVLLLHPWWGLNDDVTAFADRLAASGFAVLAPDLYGGAIAETIEEAERLAGALDEATADAIVLAAIDRMGERLGPESKIGTLGLSMGAAWALWLPAKRERVAAAVVYYGTVSGPVLAAGKAPVLAHFAAADPYEPEDNIAAFETALRRAGRPVTIHRYPETGHWFAEPSRDAYRPEAAELAFARTVTFFRSHLGATTH